ncbi:MAG TPA: ABC transporter ATP-binding protein, partial [Conexibacter sp.]|nr:ABC transporter ATP-binding protein [Conexibacter sp.]
VDDVTVAVEAGEAVGIVGESGSGKTTLGRLLIGALEPTAGTVEVEGRAWSAIGRKDPTRRRVQMVFQDPYGALNPWRTPIKTVAEVIQVWDGARARAATERAEALLAEVGITEDAMRRRPHKLSGGQCQRVGIARALAADPEVLVADEPTSSLDVSVQAQILNLLRSLRERRGLALVLISHDLSIVRYATDRALVMYGGQVVEEGPTEALLVDPAHPYTRVLVDAIPGREGPAETVRNDLEVEGGCVFASQCPHVHDACLAQRPPLRGDGQRAACVLVRERAA